MERLLLLSWFGAYLVGSVPFAIVVTRLMKLQDPRAYGSRNPGATNVLRGGNKAAALLTLLGDGFKGWLVVWGLQHLLPALSGSTLTPPMYPDVLSNPELLVAGGMVGVFLGHLFSVFLRFSGGKGVATALGIMLGLEPLAGLLLMLIWLSVARLTRYSSVAALTAAVASLPVYAMVAAWHSVPRPAAGCAIALISVLLIWRHRCNIRHLRAGTEVRIGAGR